MAIINILQTPGNYISTSSTEKVPRMIFIAQRRDNFILNWRIAMFTSWREEFMVI
jgi:hypothetical protein